MIVISYPLARETMLYASEPIIAHMKPLGFEYIGGGGGGDRHEMEFEGNPQAERLFEEYADTHAAKLAVATGGPIEIEVSVDADEDEDG